MNFKKLMWWRDNRPKEEKDALDKARELMELMAELHIPGQRIEEGFRTYEPEHVLLLEGAVFFSDGRQVGVGMLSEDLEGVLDRLARKDAEGRRGAGGGARGRGDEPAEDAAPGRAGRGQGAVRGGDRHPGEDDRLGETGLKDRARYEAAGIAVGEAP